MTTTITAGSFTTTSFTTGLNAELTTLSAGQLNAAVQNAVTQAVGTSVNQAALQLNQQNGLPKFLVHEIGNITKAAVQGLANNASPAAAQALNNAAGHSLESFVKDLTKAIVDAVRHETESESGGKTSGGSWMQAIAKAMGTVMGKKASDMVKLSNDIAALSAQSAPGGGTASQEQQMKAASDTQVLNTRFQATGQEFNLLQTTFSTAIKTIGEGMSSVARKQ